MQRFAFWATMILLLLGSMPATADNSACYTEAQTQLELNQCAAKELMDAEEALNSVSQRIQQLYSDQPAFLEALTKAQNAWTALRDANFLMQFPQADKDGYYGSVFPMCADQFLAELTRQRTDYLRQWIEGTRYGEGGDVCVSSLMSDWQVKERTAALQTTNQPQEQIAPQAAPLEETTELGLCPFPGDVLHWRADYCMWVSQTDDILAETVQHCMEEQQAKDEAASASDCDLKRRYKQLMCEFYVQTGLYAGTIEHCLEADETTPQTVRQGGVEP